MDFFSINDGIGLVEKEFFHIQESLDNHIKERDVIARKLDCSSVPEGKKEKLEYRRRKLIMDIIPGLTEKMRRLSEFA